MLRQARLEKQPIGRSSGLATLSNSGPFNPHVPDSSNTIVSTDQTSTDGDSIFMRSIDRFEHDDEMGVSGSTNTHENQLDNSPAASIHLISPGPRGPLIFDLEHPFDIDAMYADKMKFDWLESQIATAKYPI
ncbi:hypothetical protein FBU30_011096 [Linnemannia zychae]|nr:hypothetical protein FBU30_011096 [Linnemannia zychae]